MAGFFKNYLLQILVAGTTGFFVVAIGAGFYKAEFAQVQAATAENTAAITRLDNEGPIRLRSVQEADHQRIDRLEDAVKVLSEKLAERTATEQALLREMTALRQELRLRRE